MTYHLLLVFLHGALLTFIDKEEAQHFHCDSGFDEGESPLLGKVDVDRQLHTRATFGGPTGVMTSRYRHLAVAE